MNQEQNIEINNPEESTKVKQGVQGAKKQERLEKEKKQKRKQVIAALLAIISIIILLVLIKGTSITDGVIKFDLTPDSGASETVDRDMSEIKEELNKKLEEGMMNISINTNPVFNNGIGNVLITNKEQNIHPQIVEIFLEDDDTTIYQSGLIEVGKSVEYGELIIDLEPGTYDCYARFYMIDISTGDRLGSVAAKMTCVVN